MSGNRALELSEKMEGERREKEKKKERETETEKENAPHDFFFIAAAPLVARGLRAR